jgi:hypothetical protein
VRSVLPLLPQDDADADVEGLERWCGARLVGRAALEFPHTLSPPSPRTRRSTAPGSAPAASSHLAGWGGERAGLGGGLLLGVMGAATETEGEACVFVCCCVTSVRRLG